MSSCLSNTENILLDKEGHIRLADFGFARDDIKDGILTYTFCGSPEYLSPEMIQRCGHSKSTDMWSFGCLLFELLYGEPPFRDSNYALLYQKIRGGCPPLPSQLSPDAQDLIQQCLAIEEDKRPTASVAMQHPFFAEIDWSKIRSKDVSPPMRPAVFSPIDTSNFDIGFTSIAPEPISPLHKKGSKTASRFRHSFVDTEFEDF